ncbi:MAG: alpha/beta hydrolase-fold protein [Burkholderiaceae bacterium]
MLPGAYDTADDFLQNGFVDEVRQRRIAADVWMANTHIGYYGSGLVAERLHQDVILPARQKNYAQIWLAGLSLGGYGSLLYAQQYDEMIDGMFLMAPFLGNRSLVAQIANVGGLKAWKPGTIEEKNAGNRRWLQDPDYDERLWAWLKSYGERRAANTTPLQLHLGYGAEDRFRASHQLLSGILPEDHVKTVPGGHQWEPWKVLWSDFLDRAPFPKCG